MFESVANGALGPLEMFDGDFGTQTALVRSNDASTFGWSAWDHGGRSWSLRRDCCTKTPHACFTFLLGIVMYLENIVSQGHVSK